MSTQAGEQVAELAGESPADGRSARLTALLSPMRLEADPLADQAIADILGPWDAGGLPRERLDTVNRLIGLWVRNGDLDDWATRAGERVSGPHVHPTREMIARLDAFVQAARALPPWADPERLERAEKRFYDDGFLSCLLLFCSSLPECYVAPGISEVLQSTGQLVERTEHRIRSTAAMIFPVMMVGGLTSRDGSGIAQALKVRLIHATIRNLLLRGHAPRVGAEVPPLPSRPEQRRWHDVLCEHGWQTSARGLPVNQEELAYTLLTFGYVCLRGLRRLGVPWGREDEEAYLHAWNVAGHVLGIRTELMAQSMDEAKVLYEAMQARARARPLSPDPRPMLGRALMQTMEAAMPAALLKPFPVLMTGWLCGRRTLRELGLAQRQPIASRILFVLFMGVARAIDAAVHRTLPLMSIGRLTGRALSYPLMTRLLMKETSPLRLPRPWLAQVEESMGRWRGRRRAAR